MSQGRGWVDRKVDGQGSKGNIRGYHDLVVYQNAYAAMLDVYKLIIPKIPRFEYDLVDQLRRSSKAVPRYVKAEDCERLIGAYDTISRQLYKLSVAWQDFQRERGFQKRS